eukprot:CAMPEP_0194547304 /NCGR_PEP_ID=MMETSP0253-20130528/91960_1 /TAXON_ID=2966 /ORGANISM="Noctiluca scintillans" /LENGTH=67 /DNA_ID=CAMNT_0039394495 /DNA_START=138 /DNA_END=341 /DNA_ORIENTATION=+
MAQASTHSAKVPAYTQRPSNCIRGSVESTSVFAAVPPEVMASAVPEEHEACCENDAGKFLRRPRPAA